MPLVLRERRTRGTSVLCGRAPGGRKCWTEKGEGCVQLVSGPTCLAIFVYWNVRTA